MIDTLENIVINNPNSTILQATPILILTVILIYFIYKITSSYLQSKKYLKYDLSQIDKMDGLEFEKLLCVYFSKLGYKSYVTPSTNDFGADLVLKKNHERTVVQAKRYKQKVGLSAVQEVVASKAYYNATKATVVTNSFFTDSAKKLAKVNNVELIDRNDFIKILEVVRKEVTKNG